MGLRRLEWGGKTPKVIVGVGEGRAMVLARQVEGAGGAGIRPSAHIVDLGSRIELQSMDPQFHDITIGLYQQQPEPGIIEYFVHSYSGIEGTNERLARIVTVMLELGGMARAGNDGQRLRFGCGEVHKLACRRLFVEACKVKPGIVSKPMPLEVVDKTTGRHIKVVREDGAIYRVTADGLDEGRAQRVGAIGRGLSRLAQMELIGDDAARVRFGCGQPHDELVGLLLPRALNLRAAMREQEEAMSRGLLVAPSAQKS